MLIYLIKCVRTEKEIHALVVGTVQLIKLILSFSVYIKAFVCEVGLSI